MKRLVLGLCALLLGVCPVYADPADAVVKITVPMGRQNSCGSGTVIQSGPAHSLVLTCAHLWSDESERPDPYAYQRQILLDAPAPSRGPNQKVGVRLLAIDYKTDLALIQVGAQLPWECKIAPAGTHASHCLSAGYDHAQLPGFRVPVTPAGTHDGWTWTRQIPQDGRSGGALIDADTGKLVGVCHGYRFGPGIPTEGMYVPLVHITAFLEKYGGGGSGGQPLVEARPRVGPSSPYDPFSPAYRAPVAPVACAPGGG